MVIQCSLCLSSSSFPHAKTLNFYFFLCPFLGVRPLQYLPHHPIWPVIQAFLRMEPLGPRSLASLWMNQLPQGPVHSPGPQATMKLPRYKLRHPRRKPPRKRLHS